MNTNTAAHLAEIDGLLAHPLNGPPGCTVASRTSQGFRDAELSVLQAVDEGFDAEPRAVMEARRVRWGEPVDRERSPESGEELPPPFEESGMSVAALHVWRRGDRRTGVGGAQEDRELPLELIAAVGPRPG